MASTGPAEAPAAAQAELAVGIEAYRAQRWADARAHLLAAVAQAHDLAAAHYYLGLAQRRLGEREDAADSLRLATVFRAEDADAWYALGSVCLDLGQLDESAQCLRRAASLAPDRAKIFNQLGKLALQQGDAADARAQFERACGLDPALAVPRTNLAYVLAHEFHDAARALAPATEAVRLAPGLADAQCNLGMVLNGLGRFEEAIGACEAALRLAPAHAQARVNRGLARLALERYAEGWRDYEARHALDAGLKRAAKVYAMADWQGEPLAGRTVLVYGEQGLGDEIMYASCIPELADRAGRAGRVVLECSPRLAGLFARSFPQATVVGVDAATREADWLSERGIVADCKVAVGSLPLHLRGTRESFAGQGGYLQADPARRARWRARLAALGPGRTVGISWRGGVQRTGGAARSIELTRWAPVLATAGVRFVSLQYGDSAAERAAVQAQLGTTVTHWPEAIADYEETAALAAELDLVVTIATSAADLAGGLGRTAWVLATQHPDWRFLQQGDAMRWYPSVRLFRQRTAGDWAPVLDAVAGALGTFARAGAGDR
jgi:tetratricopeptide (TPR) repeat protein